MTHLLKGGCHCGNVELTFATDQAPEAFSIRACQCSFCTRHGARTATDRKGRLEIWVRSPAELNRYQFALKTAEFFVCKRCGVYLAAVLTTPEGTCYATVNINALDARQRFTQQPLAVDYEGENAERRITRRKQSWTPTVVHLGVPR
jgi:hypothetical protein